MRTSDDQERSPVEHMEYMSDEEIIIHLFALMTSAAHGDEDCAQQALIDVWRAPTPITNLAAYACTAARRRWLMMKRLRQLLPLEGHADGLTVEPEQERRAEARQALEAVIPTLPVDIGAMDRGKGRAGPGDIPLSSKQKSAISRWRRRVLSGAGG